jgi:ribosomal protein L37AE/L43A
MTHWDAIADAERRARSVRRTPRLDPPECPHCHRMMTTREASDQGACDNCFGGELDPT